MPCQSLSDTFRVSFALKLNEDHLAKAPLLHTFAIWNLDKITQTVNYLRFQRFIFWFVLWFIHPDKKDLFILTSVKLATCVWGEQFLHFSIKRRSNNICALPPVTAAKVIEPCVKSKSDFVTFVSLRKIPIWGVAVRPFWCFVSTKKQKSLHRNALMTKLKTFLDS